MSAARDDRARPSEAHEPLTSGFAVAVWIARDFVPEIAARSADGRYRLTAELSEPDERGVCSLVLTRHEDDIVAAAAADATERAARIAEAWEGSHGERRLPEFREKQASDKAEEFLTVAWRMGGSLEAFFRDFYRAGRDDAAAAIRAGAGGSSDE